MGSNKRPKMDIVERDRFAELPDAMILHILSFLPTVYAIRMSLVSKRWRNIWLDLPVLDLSSFAGIRKSQKLCSFVSKCFRLHETDSLTKFKLKTLHSWKNIDGWLKLVAKSNNVKEFDICIQNHRNVFLLPVDVLQMRSLTHLSLSGVSIKGYDSSICLSSLVFLSLKTVCLDDLVLNNLFLSCTSLEKLIFYNCVGLSSFKISSSRLKFLDFNSGRTLTLQVEAANLESFVAYGCKFESESDVFLCGRLRTLSFSFTELRSKWFEGLISRLPCLERFSLYRCTMRRSVEIRSKSLKHFIFRYNTCHDKSKIVMDTPNLAYFCFMGDPLLDISMNLPDIQEAELKFTIKKTDATWYTNFLYFLSNLGCAKTVGIFVYSEEALIIPDRLRKVCKAPSLTTKHMKVRTCEPLVRNNELEDSLFWIAPSLETLSMEHDRSAFYRR